MGFGVRVVLLVGGSGAGDLFRPLSMHQPQINFPLGDCPLLDHHIRACQQLGDQLDSVFLMGHYEAYVMTAFIARAESLLNVSVRYLQETSSAGTAGGLVHFRDVIFEDNSEDAVVCVLHTNVWCSFPLKAMLEVHRSAAQKRLATLMVTEVPAEEAPRYGNVFLDADTLELKHYVERPDADAVTSTYVHGGVYLFNAKMLYDEALSVLGTSVRVASGTEQHTRGVSSSQLPAAVIEKYGLNPLLAGSLSLEVLALSKFANAGKVFCFKLDSLWTQLKTPAMCLEATALVLGTIPADSPKLSTLSQVSGRVLVAATATIHPSAVIGPNVVIGSNVVIGRGARIRDAVILDGVVVKQHALVSNAIVGWNSVVGNWARVEGDATNREARFSLSAGGVTVLGDGVHVDNEVHLQTSIVLPNKAIKRNASNQILL